MTEERENLLRGFIQWLRNKELRIIHLPSLATSTHKGEARLIREYLQEAVE